jgi:hypothetical protein
MKKFEPAPPEFLGDLDPHETELEELGDQISVHLLRLVHLRHERSDLRGREIPHRLPEHPLLVRERSQGGMDGGISLCERVHLLYLFRLDPYGIVAKSGS